LIIDFTVFIGKTLGDGSKLIAEHDLCHPGDNAVRYIEEIFANSFFSHETKEKLKEIEKENKFLNHRKLK
jgi:hypothetical protein